MQPQLNHSLRFSTNTLAITEISRSQTTQPLGHRIKGAAITRQTVVPGLERLLTVARHIQRQFQLHEL
jgi:hypothetical protein